MAKSRRKIPNSGIEAENASGLTVTPEERRRMIAEAAYYRAESRGFVGGDPMLDWLEAEQEINNLLLLNPQAIAREVEAHAIAARNSAAHGRAGAARHTRRPE